jgi:hypothetical protein
MRPPSCLASGLQIGVLIVKGAVAAFMQGTPFFRFCVGVDFSDLIGLKIASILEIAG